MTKDDLDDVLTILSIVQLTRNETGVEDYEAYVGAACSFVISRLPQIEFSPDMAIQWFENNRPGLISLLKTGDADMKIRRLLWSIDNAPYRNQIFEKMIEIGHSGSGGHESENELIRLAADLWGTPYLSTREAVAV